MIELLIRLKPLSVNHMYGRRGTRTFLFKEGKDYKEAVAAMAVEEIDEMFDGEVCVDIQYFFPDRRRRDVTNYEKPLLDCLSGIVYKDDCQITDISIHKDIDRDDPRTIIKIWSKTNA